MIEGDKEDILGGNSLLQQRGDRLIHDGRLARAPGAAQDDGAADILAHHAAECLKIGKAVHGLDEFLLNEARPPPRIIGI